MKVSIGADHAAYDLKAVVINHLESKGIEVIDRGTYSKDSCDYPDYGIAVAEDVANGNVDKGIVICYTGIGISIAANKVKGVRCALVGSVDAAVLTREHNDSNCLAMGAKYTPNELAIEIVDTWLGTEFSNMEKHQRRIDKITKYEV